MKYDDVWFRTQMTRYLAYWEGKRGCQGVDIEEAWKCHSCEYQESCAWIARKTKEIHEARLA